MKQITSRTNMPTRAASCNGARFAASARILPDAVIAVSGLFLILISALIVRIIELVSFFE